LKLSNQSDYCRLQNLAGNANFKFAAKNVYADTSLTVNTTASIGYKLNCGSLSISTNARNNCLFNNTGANHATYEKINIIDKFGYTFIQGATNGPGTGETQYYSWYIGLKNEYPFANSVNGYYGMQFAVGRIETNPKLSVRRNEGNVWTGWEGLAAEKAVSLTSGDKTI
jgi:hypothetical protein